MFTHSYYLTRHVCTRIGYAMSEYSVKKKISFLTAWQGAQHCPQPFLLFEQQPKLYLWSEGVNSQWVVNSQKWRSTIIWLAEIRGTTCRPAQSVHENETQVLGEQNWHLGLEIPSPRCLFRFRFRKKIGPGGAFFTKQNVCACFVFVNRLGLP